MKPFPSPVWFPLGRAGSARRHAVPTCDQKGPFVLPQDVSRHVSPPHLRTSSEAAGLLRVKELMTGLEGGGILKSVSWRLSLENVAAVARHEELSLWVSSQQPERRCPVLWSHFTEEETKAQTD